MIRPALILFFLVLTACGSGGGGSSGSAGACAGHAFLGTYKQNAATATFVFNADCTGTESVDCGLTYTFVGVTDPLASLRLNVTASNGGGACVGVGTTFCSWSIPTAGQVTIDCGFGNVTYTRIL